MERITAFKISTGEIFENEHTARNREIDLAVDAKIDSFCDLRMSIDMRAEDVADILKEHKDELRKVLKRESKE